MAARPEKVSELIRALLHATEIHRIEWSGMRDNAHSNEDTYTISLTRGTVALWSRDGDGVAPYVLQIRGEQGEIVEEIHSHSPDADDETSGNLSILFLLASGRSRGADAVIDSLLEDLRDQF